MLIVAWVGFGWGWVLHPYYDQSYKNVNFHVSKGPARGERLFSLAVLCTHCAAELLSNIYHVLEYSRMFWKSLSSTKLLRMKCKRSSAVKCVHSTARLKSIPPWARPYET